MLALEEHLAGYRERLLKLGFDRDTPLYSHVGHAPTGAGLEWLQSIVDRYRPALVVIDTLSKLVRPTGGDINDYIAVGVALEPFTILARERNLHCLLVHHARKGGGDFGEQALGSTALTGGVDTVIDLRRDAKNGARFVETQNRYGEAIEATSIELDPETGRTSLAAHTRAGARDARTEQAIIDWLGDQPESQTLTSIRSAEAIQASAATIGAAVRRLVRSGMVVSDSTGRYPRFAVPNGSGRSGTAVPPFSPTGRGNGGNGRRTAAGTAGNGRQAYRRATDGG